MGPHQVTHLNMTESDKNILLEVLKMKLSCDVVQRLQLNTNTQKCEAVNRSISVSVPKNVNYSRNFEARVHSTIHRLNNRLGSSLKTKVKHLGVYFHQVLWDHWIKWIKHCTYHHLYPKYPENRKCVLERQGYMIQAHLRYRTQPRTGSHAAQSFQGWSLLCTGSPGANDTADRKEDLSPCTKGQCPKDTMKNT
jgi:hypothetical protein